MILETLIKKAIRNTSIILLSFVLIFAGFRVEACMNRVEVKTGEALKQAQALEQKMADVEAGLEMIIHRRLYMDTMPGANKIIGGNTEPDFYTVANMDLRTPANVTSKELNDYLEGSALEGLGEALINAEDEYGVNAMFLLAIAKHESANGTSRLARNKNNLFGFGANDSDPYGMAKTFATKDDCIMTVAQALSKNYLRPAGRYHRGFSVQDVNQVYASDKAWGNSLVNIMLGINESIGG